MMHTDFDAGWDKLAEEVLSGIKEWRLQHTKASLREIERVLDERVVKMRVQLLQEATLERAAKACFRRPTQTGVALSLQSLHNDALQHLTVGAQRAHQLDLPLVEARALHATFRCFAP